jgi:hypothetical protein
MPEMKARDPLKPFCPVHHWRMAHDSGSSKVRPSYRCSYESCPMRYAFATGYFEAGKRSGDRALLSFLEIVSCKHNADHHPCIVGYAKESDGGQTEEWRQWQCSVENCEFSLRQKLSRADAARIEAIHFAPQSAAKGEQHRVFAKH